MGPHCIFSHIQAQLGPLLPFGFPKLAIAPTCPLRLASSILLILLVGKMQCDSNLQMTCGPKNRCSIALFFLRRTGYDRNALPDGHYYIQWHEKTKRRREGAGATIAEAPLAMIRTSAWPSDGSGRGISVKVNGAL